MVKPSAIDDPLAYEILGACLDVHRELGPGLLESNYQEAVGIALTMRGLEWTAQVALRAFFAGRELSQSYRADFVVGPVLLELKSVRRIRGVHLAQVQTYLRWSGCRTGLLVNFNRDHLMSGVHRMPRRGPTLE